MTNISSNDVPAELERPADVVTHFRLYVADETFASEQAAVNLQVICEHYFPGRYLVETVDILRTPLRALDEGILLTPTLVKMAPPPVRKIVGDLSDTTAVLYALGIREK
jgi:circadian clock protein KaiB